MTANDSTFLYSYLLDGRGSGKPLDLDGVRSWTPADGKCWVHFDVANTAAKDWVLGESGIPEHAVRILLAGETRPRASILDGGLLAVLRGVNTNPGEDPEDMVSVRLWIDRDRIVSSRRRKLLSVVDVADAIESGEGPRSPAEVLLMIVDRLTDRIGEFVDSIEASIDDFEEDIRTGDPNEFRPRLAGLRRQIASVRRFVSPQRDALDRLARYTAEVLDTATVQELHQESDRVTRYLEDLDLARERAVVLHEELLSRIAQEQNSRMYVLSIVAAIFLPLTFVTGLLGMNVGGLPGLEDPKGFGVSLVVMVILGLALLAYFRHKKWL